MTQINLCEITEFNKDYKNVMDFESRQNQLNFMYSKLVMSLQTNAKIDNFTTTITVSYTMDNELRKCDYIYCQTTDGKYLFFFIDNMEILTPSTVKLYLTLDVWQTYFLDIQLLPSYVVRQHVPRWKENGYPTDEFVSEGSCSEEYVLESRTPITTDKIPSKGVYIYYTSTPIGVTGKEVEKGSGGDTPKPDNPNPDTPSGLIEIEDENGNVGMFPCASGRFTNVYPYYNDGTEHGAVDLSGNDGVNIYPPRDNMTVVKVVGGYPNERNDSLGYGNHCVLEDNETKQHYWFGHMRATPLVQEGDTVNQNTVLGFVGTSGYSTGAHLHYEIRVSPYGSDNRINPIKYIYSSDGTKHEPSINETFTRGELYE